MIEAQKRNSNHDKSNRRYNTMTTYFINCKTLDELKKAYKAAAMKYHPDMGGDTATMQAINAEYEARFEVLKRSQNTQAAEDIIVM